MKQYNKHLAYSLLLGMLALAGCKEEEELNLKTYSENQPSITISNTKGASEVTLNATYGEDGILKLDGPLSRTYTIHLAASPEDAVVTFEPFSTNVPNDKIDISATEVIVPAGFTEASVTLGIKNNDLDFAQTNNSETSYELGVKATVKGYKMPTESIISKVTIKKEAYFALGNVVGPGENKALFIRSYNNGEITNKEPISYTFKVQLNKPAIKDIKIDLTTSGLDTKFLQDIKVEPQEIIIPAGQSSTSDITWTIADNFLLQTEDEEDHTLIVTASMKEEDPTVALNEKTSFLTFKIHKALKGFDFVTEKDPKWVDMKNEKKSWSIVTNATGGWKGILDGVGGTSGNDVYSNSDFYIILDMKTENTIAGLGIDYYGDAGSSAKKITISTSMDNVTWITAGEVAPPKSVSQYLKFVVPVTVRYVKYNFSGAYGGSYIDLTELYVYK